MIQKKYPKNDPYIRRIHRLIIPVFVAALFIAAHSQKSLVSINGESITTENVDQYIYRHHRAMSKSKDIKSDKEKILNKLINDKLIVLEALSMGLSDEDWIKKELDKKRTEFAIQEFLKENPPPKPQVKNKDVNNYFKKYYQKIQIQTISVLDSSEAVKLLNQIKKGAAMDSIAKKISLDSRKFEGGLHNLKKYADIDTVFRNRAEKLKTGEFANIFRYKKAFMVMKVVDKKPADTSEFDKYKEGIRKFLESGKKQSVWDNYMTGLEKKYPVREIPQNLSLIIKDSSIASTNDFLNGSDSPVIEFNKQHYISDRNFRFNISRQIMSNSSEPFPILVRNALKGLKAELLLSVAAEKNGFFKMEKVIQKFQHSRDSLLIEAYLKEMVVDHISFNQTEFESYYNENPEKFRRDSEILLLELQATTRDSILKYSERLKEGASFNYILRNKPDVSPGDMIPKWVPLSVFPDSVKMKIAEAQKSEIVGPLQLSKGWILFQKLDEKKGAILAFDEVQLQLRELFFKKKFDQKLEEVLIILKKNFKIRKHQKNINVYLAENHD